MHIFDLIEHYFCCPHCRSDLRIERLGGAGDGLLECEGCARCYMVLDNIPVMLPPSLVDRRVSELFARRHGDCLTGPAGDAAGEMDSGSDRESDSDSDRVKEHQVSTWDSQYESMEASESAERTIPVTREVHLADLFYSKSRKKLHQLVTRKRHEKQNGLFLDIGCGTGAFTYEGMQNFSLYFGMDISYQAITRCQAAFPYKNCLFFVGDAENIPLKDSVVNVCGAQWLFEHLAAPERCAGEIFRVLGAHGAAYIDTNHHDFALTYRWCQMVLTPRTYWRRMEEAGHSHGRFFSVKRLQTLLQEAGFGKLQAGLCYFLLDMAITKGIIVPLQRVVRNRKDPIGTIVREAIEGTGVEIPGPGISVPVPLCEYEKKVDFTPVVTKVDALKKLYNFFVQCATCCLLPDRVLEWCGKGESVIAVAEKE